MSSLPKKDDDGNAVISHTQMNKFNMCPKAYEYRYVEGIKGIMPGRVKVGSAFDKAANFVNEERMLLKDADPENAMHRAVEYMDDPGEEFDETDIADDDNLLGRIDEAVREYAATRTGAAYHPHLTLGIGPLELVSRLEAEPFAPFPVRPVSISLYQLGEYGVAQRKLHHLHTYQEP